MISAKQAVLSQQLRVDTIANNVANVSTTGFKSTRVDFKDTLYTAMAQPTKATGGAGLGRGTGVMVAATTLSFEQGIATQTGSILDFCISGDGFFTLKNSQGDEVYTRNGAFAVSVESGNRYLVNADGNYVLDKQGNKIKLPEGKLDDMSINEKGELFLGSDNAFATLKLSTFSNPEGLQAVGSSSFMATDASGKAAEAKDATVTQGFLESSNVDLTLEMTRLIQAQRALSLAGKALTTADEMDALANNLRR
ncbi:MAG: flagellar hook-basal body protein [Bacillota bacterium]